MQTKGLLVLAVLTAFALAVPVVTDNHHFVADDWPLIAYANGFSTSWGIIEFARNLLRPVEGAFWIVEIKLLGLNRSAVHVVSSLLNVGACGLFWQVLRRAYPERPVLAAAAALTAFFLPVLTTTTFVMFIDNSRLSMLFYWAGVAVCQAWAIQPRRHLKLFLGGTLLLTSTLTYENAVLLILVVPMFVLPVLLDALSKRDIELRRRIIALGMSLATTILCFLIARYVLLGGGVHRIEHFWPSIDTFANYLRIALDYLILSIHERPTRLIDWTIGSVIGAATLWILQTSLDARIINATEMFRTRTAIVIAGIVMAVLGVAPYMLAFSPPAVANIEGGSRFYSSAAYGIALLLTLITMADRPLLRRLGASMLAAYIGLNAAFASSLAPRWAEAANLNCHVWKSLLAEIPATAVNTTFLFAGAELTHRGATVIGEPAGTRFLLPFLYGHRTWDDLGKVTGYHLAPFERDLPTTSDRRLTVKADGLMVRGRNPTQPIDPNRVILVRRDGERLVVLDRLTPNDELVSANWLDGVTEVRTNRSLILPAPPNSPSIEDRLAALSIRCR